MSPIDASDVLGLFDSVNMKRREVRTITAEKKDYLAVIDVSGVGSWARGPDKAKTIKDVVRIFKQDFKSHFVLKKGTTLHIDVLDVTGHDKIRWDCRGFWNDDVNKPFASPVERVTVTL
jgi:hypothetical protein